MNLLLQLVRVGAALLVLAWPGSFLSISKLLIVPWALLEASLTSSRDSNFRFLVLDAGDQGTIHHALC